MDFHNYFHTPLPALLCTVDVSMAPLKLCIYLLFYVFLLSLFTRITSALFIYDKTSLLDIGHRCTNLLQDTLSTDPAWPLEILRSTEVNKGHLNNPKRRRKHRGRHAGIRNRLRERAHSPPLPSILLANVQSLENKMDDLIRPPFCRVPARLTWNISPLSAAHSICPGSFHQLSLLPFTFHHRQTLAWLCPNSTMSSAATSINTLTLPLSSLGTLTKPTSRRSCQTFISIYPVQLEDRIHCIIATPSLRMPTKLVPCRLLANRTMPPFSSHRNINKGSFRDPWWRGK